MQLPRGGIAFTASGPVIQMISHTGNLMRATMDKYSMSVDFPSDTFRYQNIGITFPGSNSDLQYTEEDFTGAYTSWFKSPVPGTRGHKAMHFRKLWLKNIYHGVDFCYHFENSHPKYDIIINAGARLGDIRIRYEGITSLEILESGELQVNTPMGQFREMIPDAWTEKNGFREKVSVSFAIVDGNTVTFTAPGLSNTETILIDPVLDFATFLGGGAFDGVRAMDRDKIGNLYLAGNTVSTDFPLTPGVYDTVLNEMDVFVTKLNPAGTALIFSTLIGGSGVDQVNDSRLVSITNDLVLAGVTWSEDFPVTPGCLQDTFAGSQDGFVLKLSATGDALLFSTYLGGNKTDFIYSVDVDPGGNVYTGGSCNGGFPVTANSYQPNYAGCSSVPPIGDIIISKLTPDGTAFVYSTYVGGSRDEVCHSISVDSLGNCLLAGWSTGKSPVNPNGYCTNHTVYYADAYLAKLNADGNFLLFGTYLTCTNSSQQNCRAYALKTMRNGNILIGGSTNGRLPVTSPAAYDTTHNGSLDAFVACFDPLAHSLLFATYLGDSAYQMVNDIDVNYLDEVFIVGMTSDSFPTTCCAFDQVKNGLEDVFVSKLSPDGSKLVYSTFIGGTDSDMGYCITAKGDAAYVAGATCSANFPYNPLSYDTALSGGWDGFAMKLNMLYKADAAFLAPDTICYGDSLCLSNISPCGTSFLWDFGDGSSSALENPCHIYQTPGTFKVTLTTYSENTFDTASRTVTVILLETRLNPKICFGDSIFLESMWQKYPGTYYDTLPSTTGCDSILISKLEYFVAPELYLPADTGFCEGGSVVLSGSDPFWKYHWSNGDTTFSTTITSGGLYTLTITDQQGCSNKYFVQVNVQPLPLSSLDSAATLCQGEILLLDPGACPGCSFLWSTGDTTQTLQINESGEYKLVLKRGDCISRDSIKVEPCTEITVPNVFTPNEDGKNDLFMVKSEKIDHFLLVVFSRWGREVFRTGDPEEGWDGKQDGKDCAEGTYYFHLTWEGPGTGINRRSGQVKGTVTLLR